MIRAFFFDLLSIKKFGILHMTSKILYSFLKKAPANGERSKKV